MEFEPIADCVPGLHHRRILGGVACRQGYRKELAHSTPDELGRFLQAHAFGQGSVDRHIPAGQVLHEERRVGNMIKQRCQPRRLGAEAGLRFLDSGCCAPFH